MPRISTPRRLSQAFLWVVPFISPILMLVYRVVESKARKHATLMHSPCLLALPIQP